MDWLKTHTRLTERATEWEHHNHNASYLLAGVAFYNFLAADSATQIPF